MSVYLRAKFQVSSITLTCFRHGGAILHPPPQREPLKDPPRFGLRYYLIIGVLSLSPTLSCSINCH